MKYGLLTFPRSENAGDTIQSIAAMRFLPRVDLFVDREGLNRVAEIETGRIRIIGNAWYSHNPENWPPSKNVDLLPLSMHFSPRAIEAFFSDAHRDYFTRLGSIGARDTFTLGELKKRDVDAYFSGCLTLTLVNPLPALKTGRIVVCDVSSHVLEHIQVTARLPVDVVTHAEASSEDYAMKLQRARRLLALYAQAHCVVTSRLHAALPALAFGTPVFLLLEAKDSYRFDGLREFLHHGTDEAFISGTCAYDINRPPPNSRRFFDLRAKLEDRVHRFIADEPERASEDRDRRDLDRQKTKITVNEAVTKPGKSWDKKVFGTSKDGEEGDAIETPQLEFDAMANSRNLLISQLVSLRAELDVMKQELQSSRTRTDQVVVQMIEAQAAAARLQAMYDLAKDTLASQAGTVGENERLRIFVRDLEYRISVKDERLSALDSHSAAIEAELVELRQRLTVQESEFNQASESLSALNARKLAAEALVAELQQRLSAKEISLADHAAEHDENIQLKRRIAEFEARILDADDAHAQAAQQYLAAHAEVQDLTVRLSERESELADRIADFESLRAEFDRAGSDVEARVSQLVSLFSEKIHARAVSNQELSDKASGLGELFEDIIDSLAAEHEVLADQLRTLFVAPANKLFSDIRNSDLEKSSLSRELDVLGAKHADGVAENLSLRATLDKLEHQLLAQSEQLISERANATAYRDEIDQNNAALAEIRRNLNGATVKYGAAKAENLTLRDNLWKLENRLQTAEEDLARERSFSAEQLRAVQDQSQAAQEQHRSKLQELDRDFHKTKVRYAVARAENLTLRDNVWHLENRLSSSEEALARGERRIADMEEALKLEKSRTAASEDALKQEQVQLEIHRAALTAENHALHQHIEGLPWRVIRIYHRVRRFIPRGLLIMVGRRIPGKQA